MTLNAGGAHSSERPLSVRSNGRYGSFWSSQDSVDTLLAPCKGGLEFLWADSTQMRPPAYSIVEGFDIVGKVFGRERACLVDVFLDALLLQAAEEGFRDRVDAPMSN